MPNTRPVADVNLFMKLKHKQSRLRSLPLLAALAIVLSVAAPSAVGAGEVLQTIYTEVYFDSIDSVVARELSPQDYRGARLPEADTLWHPDLLGDGYEARYINDGTSFDCPVLCTIVRRKAPGHSGRAVLYVHGFNDYFFQKEMGREFNERGINFYAVDLRRYGRSLRPWQYPFDVRDMQEYFTDIDSALNQIRRDGNTDITLSGHSTGGLTTALFVAMRGARCGVSRLVTDSPFLEWNFSALYRKLLIPAVGVWSRLSPSAKIKQSHCDAYSHSLLRAFHGEWEYDMTWKMVYSPPVTASWIGSVTRAQKQLMKNASHITVPVLVMHSSRGLDACSWSRECMSADIVLNPKDIARLGARLGKEPQVSALDDGMHDLILSRKEVRAAAYDTIFGFISRTSR